MPEVESPDTRYRVATNLEQISSWLTVLIALMGLGSGAYALISLGSHELSRPLLSALALTFVSLLMAFLGNYSSISFARRLSARRPRYERSSRISPPSSGSRRNS
jgi:hypothetical protein